MTFRITTILYLFTLVAVSLAAFGIAGFLALLGMLLFWAVLLSNERMTSAEILVIGAVALVLAALLVPNVEMARGSARRAQCRNNLKQLALGIYNFHDTQQRLPRAAEVRGKNDDLHSWRLILLPFVELEMDSSKYDFDQPWDGPQNRKLLGALPNSVYECPTHSHATETNYFAITGPRTAWGDGEPRTLADITDGTENTILLIEAGGRGVHWAEPSDLTFDQAVRLLTTPLPTGVSNETRDGHLTKAGYFYKPTYCRHVAMCDGSVRAINVPVPREMAVALLTADGGEPLDDDWHLYHAAPQLDYGRVWACTAFVLVALLPAVPRLRPWVWPMSRQLPETSVATENN